MVAKMNCRKKAHKHARLEMNALNENPFENPLNENPAKIVKLSGRIKRLEDKLNYEREKSNDAKNMVKDLRCDISKKDDEIVHLKTTIKFITTAKSRCEQQVLEELAKNENINVQVEKHYNENSLLLKEIDDLYRKIDIFRQDQKTSREGYSLLQTLLEGFEHIYQVSEEKRTSLLAEIENLTLELSSARNECQDAKRSVNEEKSLRLLSETQCKRQSEEIKSLREQLESYCKECTYFKTDSTGLANELTAAEQRITDLDIKLKDCQNRIDDCITENYTLKEENSAQLTYLYNFKESNYKVSQVLAEYKTVTKDVIEQVNILENLLSEKEMCYKEREIKKETTIRQQTKLIDYLQSKMERIKGRKRCLESSRMMKTYMELS